MSGQFPGFRLSGEVRAALEAGRAVVALETSVLAQGLPPPRNLDAARDLDARVRVEGAVPAWIAVEGGAIRAGLGEADLAAFCAPGAGIAKVARRDYPAALAGGARGATTVSATLWAAARLGIEVTATGGIGGVHPHTGDVSADLLELARTPGLVVCSGPKSIVDPAATLERLEELGVLVAGYACDRLPFFLATDAGLALEHRVDTPAEAAAVARARATLGVDAAVLLCQPVPPARALDAGLVAAAVVECERRAASAGVTGKAVTPFLLGSLAEVTRGASLEANLALLGANATLAARIAVALAAVRGAPDGGPAEATARTR
jgi:pseudouridine-5'-phosphate glycosidase